MEIKTGIFLGSFDPPHKGHLSILDAAKEQCDLDDIWVIPALKNPWKRNSYKIISPFKKYIIRQQMCRELFKGYKINLIELVLYDRKYPKTSEVLNLLANVCLNNDFYIITTEETYSEIPRWHEGEKILTKYKFLIEGRDFKVTNPYPFHSTDLRNKIKNGEDIIEETNEYINRISKLLYK